MDTGADTTSTKHAEELELAENSHKSASHAEKPRPRNRITTEQRSESQHQSTKAQADRETAVHHARSLVSQFKLEASNLQHWGRLIYWLLWRRPRLPPSYTVTVPEEYWRQIVRMGTLVFCALYLIPVTSGLTYTLIHIDAVNSWTVEVIIYCSFVGIMACMLIPVWRLVVKSNPDRHSIEMTLLALFFTANISIWQVLNIDYVKGIVLIVTIGNTCFIIGQYSKDTSKWFSDRYSVDFGLSGVAYVPSVLVLVSLVAAYVETGLQDTLVGGWLTGLVLLLLLIIYILLTLMAANYYRHYRLAYFIICVGVQVGLIAESLRPVLIF